MIREPKPRIDIPGRLSSDRYVFSLSRIAVQVSGVHKECIKEEEEENERDRVVYTARRGGDVVDVGKEVRRAVGWYKDRLFDLETGQIRDKVWLPPTHTPARGDKTTFVFSVTRIEWVVRMVKLQALFMSGGASLPSSLLALSLLFVVVVVADASSFSFFATLLFTFLTFFFFFLFFFFSLSLESNKKSSSLIHFRSFHPLFLTVSLNPTKIRESKPPLAVIFSKISLSNIGWIRKEEK